MFKDSLGNVYKTLPPKKASPGAKSTKKKTAKPRCRNPHRLAKFAAQFARTEENKKRRAARRARWLEKRQAKRAAA